MEISILKQGLGASTFAKDETKHKIKALIDEYVREVEKNLKAVEGLSPTEIHELMQYEVKELVDYIPKSISNNKWLCLRAVSYTHLTLPTILLV